MTRSLFSYLVIAAMLGALLRDLQVWCAAKLFCWRKRRQTQREAKQNRELRELQTKLAAAEELERHARIAKARIAAASSVPFPQLVGGPLIITARSREEVYSLCRRISSNIASQQTVNNFSESSFENN
jgi:uncharacterized iron-regulated membrane protein